MTSEPEEMESATSPAPPEPPVPPEPQELPERVDAYAALRERDFRLYLLGNLVAFTGLQMQGIAVLWEIAKRFDRMQDAAFAVGWVGLIQVLPVFVLALPAGHLADRYDRRRIIVLAYAGVAVCSLVLAWVVYLHGTLLAIYLLLLLMGIGRAFMMPARGALLPQVVSWKNFASAVAWNGGTFHIAAVVGPALGGLIIGLVGDKVGASAPVYVLSAACSALICIMLSMVHLRPSERSREPITVRALVAGVDFVWRTKIILGTITLDLFAVLFGGATALLPIFADKILRVGPTGLGWLRAAPALGALAMMLFLAHRPPLKKAGRTLLWNVAGYGAATVVFGLSYSFWLSMLALFLVGACDMVSVVVRHTLVQLLTPDEMRGRVSAVNGIFISASNELGDFEAGMVAGFTSPLISVVSGGLGTLAVVAVVAGAWPQVGRYGRLGPGSQPQPAPPAAAQGPG
jgi:MFS family permease